MYVMSESPLKLPEQQRIHHSGSSLGDTIYGVAKTPMEQEWQLKWGQKKKALGKRLILVGGKTEIPDGQAESAAPRKTDTMVPMCWHSAPGK